MLEKILSCDVCKNMKEEKDLVGLAFIGKQDFKLVHPFEEINNHICVDCIRFISAIKDSDMPF